MFIMEFAKMYCLHNDSVCVLPDYPIQNNLSNYSCDLVELSGVLLHKTLSEVTDDETIIHDGYLEGADCYILLIEHDLFAINALKQMMQALPPLSVHVVLLNALDSKCSLDYILNYHLEVLNLDVIGRYVIPYDEIDLERQFRNQLAGQIVVQGFSKEKRMVFIELAKQIFEWNEENIKTLKKELRKKVRL